MKPYGRQHYSNAGKRRVVDAWRPLSPVAAEQLRRLLRTTGLRRLATELGTGMVTLEKAQMGLALKSDVADRLSAALERMA